MTRLSYQAFLWIRLGIATGKVRQAVVRKGTRSAASGMGDSGSMHLERVLGFPGQQFGRNGRSASARRMADVRSTTAVHFTFDLNGRLQPSATGMSRPLCILSNYGPRQQGRQRSTARLLESGNQGNPGPAIVS